MAVYSIVAAVALIMVIYMGSVLAPIPWYLYLPFVGVFILAYFWEKIIKIFRERRLRLRDSPSGRTER
jgi:divalent metal cation (Fe/Co/Zn/Cd) transporter